MTDNERKESISALRQLLAMCDFVDQYGDSIDADPYFNAVETAIESLNETRWIPVSERLPKARESVILSTKEWTGEGCYWETTKHHVIWKGYRWNATYWDDEVIAWKPLPKPYREDGEA